MLTARVVRHFLGWKKSTYRCIFSEKCCLLVQNNGMVCLNVPLLVERTADQINMLYGKRAFWHSLAEKPNRTRQSDCCIVFLKLSVRHDAAKFKIWRWIQVTPAVVNPKALLALPALRSSCISVLYNEFRLLHVNTLSKSINLF